MHNFLHLATMVLGIDRDAGLPFSITRYIISIHTKNNEQNGHGQSTTIISRALHADFVGHTVQYFLNEVYLRPYCGLLFRGEVVWGEPAQYISMRDPERPGSFLMGVTIVTPDTDMHKGMKHTNSSQPTIESSQHNIWINLPSVGSEAREWYVLPHGSCRNPGW